jgi:hypothetical protein
MGDFKYKTYYAKYIKTPPKNRKVGENWRILNEMHIDCPLKYIGQKM